MDVEFADDTTLYVDGEIGNLTWVQDVLQVFLDAIGASLTGISLLAFGWVKKLTISGIQILLFDDGFTMVNRFNIWDVGLV